MEVEEKDQSVRSIVLCATCKIGERKPSPRCIFEEGARLARWRCLMPIVVVDSTRSAPRKISSRIDGSKIITQCTQQVTARRNR